MVKNTFATIGILAVLLMSLGMVSALTLAPLSNVNESVSYTATNYEIPILLNNTDTINGTVNMSSTTTGVTFSLANPIFVNTTNTTTATITFAAGQTGAITGTITATPDSGTAKTMTYTLNVAAAPTSSTFCEIETYTDQGDLEISDFDVNNLGEGKDDEWQYLDEIEVVVEIENTNNDDDVDDVEVELRIYNKKITSDMTDISNYDVTNDFDLEDEISDDIGRLKDDEEETVTFSIKELSSDIDAGNYYMYIMAYEDGNKSGQCRSESNELDDDYYFEFTIESVDDDEAVVARNVGLDAIVDTYCDQKNLEISIPIYNLGDNDEEKVLVNIYNSGMGINEYAVIDDLDSGDDETVSFFINVPSLLSRDSYDLEITVYFDWDDDEEDDDISAYDEETSDEIVRLSIIGCGQIEPTVSASLDSESKVGKELVITASVTNNGEDGDYTISAANFASWAELVSIEPNEVSIDAGDTKTVTITLKPTKDGEHTFKIVSKINGDSSDQSVSVTIEKSSNPFVNMSNTMMYIIVAIMAVLILIVLTLIVKAARKPTRKEQF